MNSGFLFELDDNRRMQSKRVAIKGSKKKYGQNVLNDDDELSNNIVKISTISKLASEMANVLL